MDQHICIHYSIIVPFIVHFYDRGEQDGLSYIILSIYLTNRFRQSPYGAADFSFFSFFSSFAASFSAFASSLAAALAESQFEC